MNKNNNFNIGQRIHELRTKKGLSQEQLALRSNITTTYLGLLERNLKNPTIKIIEQVCHSLNISLSDFFSTAPIAMDFLDDISLQIISQISNRTDEEKQLVYRVVKEILKLRDLPNDKKNKN